MVELTKERIDELALSSESSEDLLINLFKEVFPNWDDIEKINGYPVCSKKTNMYLCKVFIHKGRKKDSFPGGLWLNYGFSPSEEIPDWQVDIYNCPLVMKGEV